MVPVVYTLRGGFIGGIIRSYSACACRPSAEIRKTVGGKCCFVLRNFRVDQSVTDDYDCCSSGEPWNQGAKL